ncbi:hypothetical protein PR048_014166 [Dryococelus australis]|uniref:Uncharacterized protein n=1 Tax=Dryococelus australis TaxID=614101 RepID=A0ABQ9HDF5_9NEOP|nr:hypothetical protein PR048_014166 [Dryococelus australis]
MPDGYLLQRLCGMAKPSSFALTEFPDRPMTHLALKAFRRHIWYFTDELVGLVMFDEDFDVEINSRMQKNLLLLAKAKVFQRLDEKLSVTTSIIDSRATEKTANIFDTFLGQRQENGSRELLSQGTQTVVRGYNFKQAAPGESCASEGINDCAESAIALIQHYN